MEESVKILRTFLEDRMAVYNEDLDKHLENMLNRLEQDERVIEEMAECISDLDIYGDICDRQTEGCNLIAKGCKDCIIDHFRKKCE